MLGQASHIQGRGYARCLGIAAIGWAAPGAWALKRGRAAEIHSFCHTPISFEEFVERYGRDYVLGTDEYNERARVFAARVAAINEHNCGSHSGHTWRAGINNLADWSEDALAGLSGSHHAAPQEVPSAAGDAQAAGGSELEPYSFLSQRGRRKIFPTSVSWGHLSAIRVPRHQGHCGSCWALTAVTVINAHSEIRNVASDYSVSQVVACTPNPNRCGGKGGCHGATAGLAFNYAMHAGLVSEKTFPYPYGDRSFRPRSEKEELSCPTSMAVDPSVTELSLQAVLAPDGSQVHRVSRQTPSYRAGREFSMVGWKRLAENKEQQIVQALVEEGPMAVSVSTGPDWHIYDGGVFPSESCDPDRVIRHATVLFGYGMDEVWSLRYWHLKNSWGEDWGEFGNMRLERLDNEEAACGWDPHPEKGSECAGGRSRVWVCGSCSLIHEATIPLFD